MKSLFICIVTFFLSVSFSDASIVLGRRTGGGGGENETLGQTTVVGNESSSSRERCTKYTTDASGITGIEYGYAYFNTTDEGTDGSFEMKVFGTTGSGDAEAPDATNPISGCSSTAQVVDGATPTWNEVTWATPFNLSGSTNYWICYYPTEEFDYDYTSVSTPNGEAMHLAGVSPGSMGDCSTDTVPDTDSGNKISLYVANYDAFDLPPLTDAQYYYVTQNGAGVNAGQSGFWAHDSENPPTSVDNAMSIAQFNNSDNWAGSDNFWAIDPGDTVFFGSTITSRATPQSSGTSGNPITLDGQASGDFDPWGGLTNNALLSEGMLCADCDYIIVQDFRMTGSGSTSATLAFGDSSNTNTTDHNIVRRNYIYDSDYAMFEITLSSSGYGTNRSTDWLIQGNRMIGFGNVGAAQKGFNLVNVDNVIVTGNELAGEADINDTEETSANVIELHATQKVLIEKNEIYNAPQQRAIEIKEPDNPSCQDTIVRWNNLHDNGVAEGDEGGGVNHMGPAAARCYIYGNWIHDNWTWGVSVMRGASNTYIWSNVIFSNGSGGINLYTDLSYDEPDGVYIKFNTLYDNATRYATGGTSWTGIYIPAGDNVEIEGNLFSLNRQADTSSPQQIYVASSQTSDVALEYNQYWAGANTPTVYWGDGYRSIAYMQTTNSKENDTTYGDAGEVEDPDFVAVGSDDFTLGGDSVNNGPDLSGTVGSVVFSGVVVDSYLDSLTITMYWDDAIDPADYDFDSIPTDVGMVDRDTDGDGWSRGAFDY